MLSLKEKVLRDQGVDMLTTIIKNKKESLSREEFFKKRALDALGDTREKPKAPTTQSPMKKEIFPKSKSQAELMMFKEIFVSPKEQRLL